MKDSQRFQDEVSIGVVSTDPDTGKGVKDFRRLENKPRQEQDSRLPDFKPLELDQVSLVSYNPQVGLSKWVTGRRGAILSFLYFFLTSIILVFVMNFVHMRMPLNVPPLPDLGHVVIPRMEPENLGDIVLVLFIVMMVVALYYNKKRWPIVINFFLTLGNLYLLRVVSISVTSLPPTENHCRDHYEKIQNIWWNSFLGLATFGSSNIHCGDLMFSGHACMATNVWMVFLLHYKKKFLIRLLATFLMVMTFFFIIATRSHYTGDIWIAFWLTVFAHRLTPYTFPFTKRKISHFFKNVFSISN